jgi:hypothetical protein
MIGPLLQAENLKLDKKPISTSPVAQMDQM